MRPPRRARVVELTVDALGPTGDGECRHEGQRVLVPFTLPGERVRVRLPAGRGPARSGHLLEVLSPSSFRVAPACRHFGTGHDLPCGGCAWQHIAYDTQLALKRDRVNRVAQAVLNRPPAVEPALPTVPPWHYRHKVHFVSENRGRATVFGHYARGSRRLVPVADCPVHADGGDAAARAFASALSATGAGGELRGWLARVSHADGRLALTLITHRPPSRRFRAATEHALTEVPAAVSVSISVHPDAGAEILGPRTHLVQGARRLREELRGVTYLLSPTAFFQTNVVAAGQLVEAVLAVVPPGLTVLDLYCGVGLFALPLALRGQAVTGIESSEAAVADAVASRQANHIPAARCRFITAPADRAARLVPPAAARAIILDPPRSGATAGTLDGVMRGLRPEVIVYVSCDLESLGRELPLLERGGYAITRLQPLDMFPHTPEVETVAVASRRGNSQVP